MGVCAKDLIKNFDLEILVEGNLEVDIPVSDINRPGLQFAGFYDYYDNKRVQIVGKTEWSYLESLSPEVRAERLDKFFSFENPCIIVTRGLELHEEFINAAKKYNVNILRSSMKSTRFVSRITNYLDSELAPETRIHGVLVDVYGIGILITGESGIGKSEAALELIKRGHRLIADDAVDIKEIDGILYGNCPYITRGMLEVRGMGIIDVAAIYGTSSVVTNKKISLLISLVIWDDKQEFDRLGVDKEYAEILGVYVEKMLLPIRPGRNIAVIIEAAAANFRYNATSNSTPVETIEKRISEMNY
ncbi:HPr kinase/phosphorylase [Clostridium punense]|uniref:HPr kinase/phosphorylase n=1 Tax=Clostridium punense TaxID=1054297 RepID=A0ABS4K969_9CLOT|nr:HPr(Ser) kinase/phosphatase [Clostridium punense]MBP2023149.1 HPr kinase/phosphorylase [Clostridium punense]